MFPVSGRYELLTGKLFDENKDAIVLEIKLPGSNYGAADLYVMDVSPAHVDEYGVTRNPEVTLFLETRNSDILAGNDVPMSLVNNLVERGLGSFTNEISVVHVVGHQLQGLSIKMSSGEKLLTTICWDKNSYSWIVCGE